jgi:outer membrane receptor for ferrienterochelin and colicins
MSAWSQKTGKIYGYILDSKTSMPLEKACVYLENTTRGAETDEEGIYFIPNVPPGEYTLTVMLIGYKSIENKKINVEPDSPHELNFYLDPKILSSSDAIVVTATRGKSLTSEVPASVDVVGLETIELIAPQNMAEVLDNIQGVFIKDYGGIGGTKSISLRGSSAEQVLVLMNGQRLNNAQNGQVDFGTLSTEGIEKIEIIRGGSSALYGADAIGGVINIITKKDQQASGVTGSLNYMRGSFNSQSMGASANFHFGKINGSAGYKHLSSDGNFTWINEEGMEEERKNNDIVSDDVFARMNWLVGDSLSQKDLDLSYKFYTSERGSPGTTELPYYSSRLWNTNQQFNASLSGKVFNFKNNLKLRPIIIISKRDIKMMKDWFLWIVDIRIRLMGLRVRCKPCFLLRMY